MKKLVLMRHGESQWNLENRFTGWVDVPLTETGKKQAIQAGKLLQEAGFEFDVAYTSVLQRAIITLNTALEQMGQLYVPTLKLWQLNERHYGQLQGLNKIETAQKYGEEQVKIWRRSYDIAPNPLSLDDSRHARFDRRYQSVNQDELPATESLKTTLDRVLPIWNTSISPMVNRGKTVLITAHGNSLRALIKHLEQLSESEIMEVNLPTATPLVYELNDDLSVIRKYYLGDADEIAAAAAAVANQGKK
jgi:2,3-bisphosphoglycerate-dependent phosphoglycerate mutase